VASKYPEVKAASSAENDHNLIQFIKVPVLSATRYFFKKKAASLFGILYIGIIIIIIIININALIPATAISESNTKTKKLNSMV
jgi:hypothetical protein